MVPSSIPHRLREVLGAIVAIMLAGFITGALARLAVPGPDPMPIWLTIAIGLAGSAGGGGIAIAIWGRGTQAIGLFSFIGAILLVIAYRRFVQKRPIMGPEALKFPDRGIGIERFKERRQKLEETVRQHQHAAQTPSSDEVTEQIRKLAELRDQGVLTNEEFDTKKAELLSRL
jgi:uncharacterized membrane protein YeaQ/YmgE (transglycosylase-associated protein family)